jgi:hypothetical protein
MKQITDLTAISTLADDDEFLVRQDSTGQDRRVSRADLRTSVQALDQGGTVQDAVRWVTPQMFGAVGDGIADDTVAVQAFVDALMTRGGDGIIAPGRYLLSSAITIEPDDATLASGRQRFSIRGYGAEFTTSGAIVAFRIINTGQARPIEIAGITVDQRNDNTALGAWLMEGASHWRLVNCHVQANSNNADYAAFHAKWADPVAGPGNFWGKLIGCATRKLQGADLNDIPVGVRIEHNCNALSIIGCSFSNTTTAIELLPNPDSGAFVNALLVMDTAFEGYETAVLTVGNGNFSGARFIGNRFESGTTVYDLSSLTTANQPASPTWISGNYYVSNAGTILNAEVYVNSQDSSVTPVINRLITGRGINRIRNQATDQHALEVQAQSAGYGFALLDNLGNPQMQVGYNSGGGVSFQFTSSRGDFAGVRSISGTTTKSVNLRGVATLASGTVNVTFPIAEPNSTYRIVTGCSAAEAIGVSAKSTTGFTLTSSNGSSSATVDWVLIR